MESLYEEMVNDIVHKNVLEKERRPDGRKLDEVRALDGRSGLVLSHARLGALRPRQHAGARDHDARAPGAEQLIETMETNGKRRFMLHYNFPPFSVGEVGTSAAPAAARSVTATSRANRSSA